MLTWCVLIGMTVVFPSVATALGIITVAAKWQQETSDADMERALLQRRKEAQA